METALAAVLAAVLDTEHVPTDGNFFDDLGADSLVMAHFCARVRKHPELPAVSMKDIYRHPTVAALAAAARADAAPADTEPPATAEEPAAPPPAHRTARYLACGAAQLAFFLGYSCLIAFATTRGYSWVSRAASLPSLYGRAVLFGSAEFTGLCAFPVLVKWLLIGRWTAREFPLWGLTYLRLWIVKVLVHANPVVLFVGSPLYPLYLRALGAKIGRHVTILSRTVPVCTDLLTIGSGSVIRKDAFFLCYRAHAGRIRTGPVTLGRDTFVGERTVLDIDSSMGDGAQLGHTSTLRRGDTVPAGARWHGSPARPTDVTYARVAPQRCGTLRRAVFGAADLAKTLLLTIPLTLALLSLVWNGLPVLGGHGDLDEQPLTSAVFHLNALLLSLTLFFGAVTLGLGVLFTVPRLLRRTIEPDKVYPLYGLRYSTHRTIARLTNLKFFIQLFGDSSYIVPYLQGIGYDLSRVEQTGSNFGCFIQHDSPFLTTVGSGTMIADGLSLLNAEFSASSFRVRRTTIGRRNFLGNLIAYPAGGRTGDNCLLATKVMIPLDGEVRTGVGLLGSPSFEIPRTVERDARFDHLRTGDTLRDRLRKKNRYNLRTIALFLLIRWAHFHGIVLLSLITTGDDDTLGTLLEAGFLVGAMTYTAVYYALVERLLIRFRPLQPQVCSIYERDFWHQERVWKVPETHFNAFNGTPFKSLLWRLLGVRMGRRVFDDGCILTERTLTAIGDDCTLNAGSKIQCHSQEDGTFKSAHSTLAADCTLGVGALVHYGVTMGRGAVLGADSFLMKGEDVPAHAHWAGNPAAPADPGRRPAPVPPRPRVPGTTAPEHTPR
ncbi:Pls/PosA family non-ribosomal peptide synthetase [Streptomyces catenulae]|uniref:Pls/PosA family non-ribosomal peptide synthetase n=1 Tax=Streptomyces catenulae TaxID=66875 RepID=A0ABV2Z279_9ACTN|nr:Pls/PosA family non-ribosomal peptide synthetase [Streptomyces catenulae]